MKICLIDNIASHYRKGIFSLMDKEWEIDWYFGASNGSVPTFDISLLRKVALLEPYRTKHGHGMKGAGRLIREYDIVIMSGEPKFWSSWQLLLRRILFYRNKQVLFWTHGWYGKEKGAVSLLKKLYFKLGTGILSYNEYSRELLIRKGFRQDKVWAIYNSLDYDTQLKLRNEDLESTIYKEHFGNNHHTLIFIGRLTPVKKLDQLLMALSALKQKGECYNLVFVGDGDESERLRSLAVEKELTENVWFYGASYSERKNAELIYNADLCVAPGNIGLTAMHVLMFGTPAVTHNDFPFQMPEFEAIEVDVTGAFFQRNDVNDMAHCVSEWFAKHGDEREMIRKNCYEVIDGKWNPYHQLNILKKVINNITVPKAK